MTAPTTTIPAGLDPATTQGGTTGHLVYAETACGRFALMWSEHEGSGSWTVVRLHDRAMLLFVPSLDVGLAGIASGGTDRELNAQRARRAAHQRGVEAAEVRDRERIEDAEDRREGVHVGGLRW